MKLFRRTLPLLLVVFVNCYAQDDGIVDINLDVEPFYFSLKKAIRHSKTIHKLDLSNSALTIFPEEIFELKELRVLILDNNQIDSIPIRIRELSKLEELSMCNNKIGTLPAEIGTLEKLRNLYLDNNRIAELPKEFFYLNDLELLLISKNNISKFPSDFQFLQELYAIDISHNKISSIPDEIGHLYKLEALELSYNKITSLPKRFFELTRLQKLYLSSNLLRIIPAEISKLNSLEILTLDSNQLTGIPAGIEQLYNLTKLFLENNEIADLFLKWKDLVNLSVLNISNNPIKFYTDINQLPNLEYLVVENISYDHFPQEFYDLQNNGTKIIGLQTKELYNIKLLESQARNKMLIEDYEGALEKYREMLTLDTNNVFALSGMANSYLNISKYDSAEILSRKALTKNPTDELYKEIRITYNYAINKTNKYDEVIQQYQLRIDSNKYNADPYFDLGKYYYDNQDYKKAEVILQNAIMVDPKHANSHFYLALVNLTEERKEAFIFSTLRFLSLEDNDQRAKSIIPFLFVNMKLKTGVKSKKGSTTSYYDSYIVRNEHNEIVYKREDPTVDLLIAMIADLTKSGLVMDDSIKGDTMLHKVLESALYINMNNIDIFKEEFKKTCDSIESNNQEENFYKTFYLPYFKDLEISGHLETFAYIINKIKREEGYINEWIKDNLNKVKKYQSWNEGYEWNK